MQKSLVMTAGCVQFSICRAPGGGSDVRPGQATCPRHPRPLSSGHHGSHSTHGTSLGPGAAPGPGGASTPGLSQILR